MSQLLQFFYAIINEENRCVGVTTSSIEVPLDTYIIIESLNYDYMDKYYDRETGIWYYDTEHTQVFEP